MKLKQSFLKVALSIGLLSVGASTLAQADEMRVLLAFDNAGHHVRQIIRNNQGTSIFDVPQAPVADGVLPDIAALGAELERGLARLVWLDEQGFVTAVTREPDPRISHSPSHITGEHGSRVGDRHGAWLVTGPDHAHSLVILMPEDETLGLAFEQWEVFLDSKL